MFKVKYNSQDYKIPNTCPEFSERYGNPMPRNPHSIAIFFLLLNACFFDGFDF